jgi:hypothetical protein
MESVESRDEIMLTVILENGDEETVDRTTRALLNELRDADLTVGLAGTGADPFAGAKSGDWLAVGTMLLSAAPAAIPKLIELLKSFIDRRSGRKIKLRFPSGLEIEVDGNTSAKDLATLASSLNEAAGSSRPRVD